MDTIASLVLTLPLAIYLSYNAIETTDVSSDYTIFGTWTTAIATFILFGSNCGLILRGKRIYRQAEDEGEETCEINVIKGALGLLIVGGLIYLCGNMYEMLSLIYCHYELCGIQYITNMSLPLLMTIAIILDYLQSLYKPNLDGNKIRKYRIKIYSFIIFVVSIFPSVVLISRLPSNDSSSDWGFIGLMVCSFINFANGIRVQCFRICAILMIVCTIFIAYFKPKDAFQWLLNIIVWFVSIDTIIFAKKTKENDEYDPVDVQNVLQPGEGENSREQPMQEQKSPSTQEGLLLLVTNNGK